MREEDAPETLESKLRREYAECSKAVEEMTKPKTLDELFEELELETADE